MIVATLKSLGAVVAGLILGMVLVGCFELVSHWLFPLPPGLTPESPDFLNRVMNEVPLVAKLTVLIAWACGVTIACFAAARLAPAAPGIHGFIVGSFFFLFAIATMTMIPHPLWFVLAAIVIFPTAIVAGSFWGSPSGEVPPEAA